MLNVELDWIDLCYLLFVFQQTSRVCFGSMIKQWLNWLFGQEKHESVLEVDNKMLCVLISHKQTSRVGFVQWWLNWFSSWKKINDYKINTT